ncbi:MAG TPA: DUF2059 domain-containing protein [Terriglobales bacterium]|nr:DUF2059 domain-containing protein [Terriglobales bacterium]
MKTLFLAVLGMVLSLPALAQKTPPAPHKAPARRASAAEDEKPSAEQVLRLLDLLRVKESIQISVDAMKEEMKGTAEQSFREKIPNPTPEQLQSVHAVVDDVFKTLVLDDLITDVVPVYQKHLTRSDVQAMIAFYSSPAGKKIMREQPAMIRESMQATAAGQQKKMEVLLARLDLRVQRLIEDEQNKTAPEKK